MPWDRSPISLASRYTRNLNSRVYVSHHMSLRDLGSNWRAAPAEVAAEPTWERISGAGWLLAESISSIGNKLHSRAAPVLRLALAEDVMGEEPAGVSVGPPTALPQCCRESAVSFPPGWGPAGRASGWGKVGPQTLLCLQGFDPVPAQFCRDVPCVGLQGVRCQVSDGWSRATGT
jgi:hypothetical protein